MYKKKGYKIDPFDYWLFFEGGQSEVDLTKHDILLEAGNYYKERTIWLRKLKLKKITEKL